MMTPAATVQRSARDRLLTAADELFYSEGIHTVGIDRVIERAGVAKATLYSAFGSKEELVAAYLRVRHEEMRARMATAVGRHRSPRARLLAPFEIQAAFAADPAYRGCAFANASAERHGELAAQAVAAYRAWIRETFTELAAAAGAPHPHALARQLHLLWDGVGVSARSDHDPAAARAARAAAGVALDAALASR